MKTHFPNPCTLTTGRLVLRQLVDSDAPEIYVQRSDPRILQFTEIQRANSLDDATAFIQKINTGIAEGKSAYWAICPQGETQLIGTICLWNNDPEKGTAELGYSLHPDHWGKGLGSEAVAAVLKFVFEEMEANIIEACTKPDNTPSSRLLERNGFVKTGSTEDGYGTYACCRPPVGMALLETERLRLREITPADAPFLFALLNTPDWIANIGDRQVQNLDDARRYAIYRIWLNCRKFGFGFYLLERKTDLSLVGMCGLVKRDFLDDVDIGYALLPQFYGQGYAVEAALAVAHFAKQALKLPRLAAIAVERNKPSLRVLEKIGLRFERMITVPDGEEELMLYKVAY